MRGTYLGVPNATWFWEYTITTEGVVSQGAVADLGAEHFVVGHSGVYLYTGGFELDDIGAAIFKEFLARPRHFELSFVFKHLPSRYARCSRPRARREAGPRRLTGSPAAANGFPNRVAFTGLPSSFNMHCWGILIAL